MKNNEIERLVDDFLARQNNTFSATWRNQLISQITKFVSETPDLSKGIIFQKIDDIHNNNILKLIDDKEQALRNRFRGTLSDYEVNCIILNARDRWYKNFDGNQSSESTFFDLAIRNELSNYIRKYHPELFIHSVLERDETVPRIKVVSIDEACNVEDTRDYFQSDELAEMAQLEELTEEYIEIDKTNKNDESKERLVKFGNYIYTFDAFNEVFRYFLLIDDLEYISSDEGITFRANNKGNLPSYLEVVDPKPKTELKHDKDIFNQIHKDLIADSSQYLNQLELLDNTTKYYHQRWEILCSADAIQWMELAISKLKESIEKRINDLSKVNNDNEKKDSIKKAPVLSSVVVCKNGDVFKCFKGQFNEEIFDNGIVRDITLSTREIN